MTAPQIVDRLQAENITIDQLIEDWPAWPDWMGKAEMMRESKHNKQTEDEYENVEYIYKLHGHDGIFLMISGHNEDGKWDYSPIREVKPHVVTETIYY